MESKKINQLATNVAPQTSDLTIIGDPVTGVSKKITLLQIANLFATTGTVTSVAVTETGDALTITGSPITSAGTINIGFAGDATQYVRGDGALADFPTSTGGGSSVSYYLNSSVSQGTIGGVAYRELSKEPVSGAGTDITASTNGYIASYITDANDPALLEVPGGNFNCEFYFSVNSNNHNPYVYAELYKYDGTTFTLLGSSQSVPEYLSNGTTLSPYYFAIPVATAALSVTDRLAIRIYVNVDGRVVTLHTENNHLCQVVTTFSKGLTSLNNLTRQVQFLATGTSGTDFNISSTTATHTFNIPDASATNRGLITTGTQTIAGFKEFNDAITGNSGIAFLNGVMPPITSSYYSGIGGNSQGISIVTRPVATNYTNNLYFPSASNSYTFPNATGTIALTSDLSSYVTLATTQTITGAKTFSTGIDLTATDGNYFLRNEDIEFRNHAISDSFRLVGRNLGSAYIYFGATGTNYFGYNLNAFILNGSNLLVGTTTDNGSKLQVTGAATFSNSVTALSLIKSGGTSSQFLMADGSVNTSVLPSGAYLPLAGGTLTGALSGTSATFSGNVAIGVTSSAWDTITNIQIKNASLGGFFGNTYLGANTYYASGGWKYISTDFANRIEMQSGKFEFYTAPSGTAGNAITFTKVLDIASTGAATFSGGLLTVNVATDNTTVGIFHAGGGTANRGLKISTFAATNDNAGVTLDAQTSTGVLAFATAGAEKMRITSGGNVGIGNSAPANKLTISNDGNAAVAFRINDTNANASFLSLNVSNSDAAIIAGGTSGIPFDIYTGGSIRMRIRNDGITMIGTTTYNSALKGILLNPDGYAFYTADGANVMYLNRLTSDGNIIQFQKDTSVVGSISTNTYSLPSDLNFKKNINTLELGLNLVTKLRAVSYNHKIDDDGAALSTGFIAQELEQSLNELGVQQNEYYILQHKPNKDETQSQYWLDYTKMIPILVNAIKEQQAQIEELKQLIKNK